MDKLGLEKNHELLIENTGACLVLSDFKMTEVLLSCPLILCFQHYPSFQTKKVLIYETLDVQRSECNWLKLVWIQFAIILIRKYGWESMTVNGKSRLKNENSKLSFDAKRFSTDWINWIDLVVKFLPDRFRISWRNQIRSIFLGSREREREGAQKN